MFELVEHLEDPAKAISVSHSLLKSGGLLLITTPDPTRAKQDMDVTHINVRNIEYWTKTLVDRGFAVKFPSLMYDTRLHGTKLIRLITRSDSIRKSYSWIKASWLNREPSYNILAFKP